MSLLGWIIAWWVLLACGANFLNLLLDGALWWIRRYRENEARKRPTLMDIKKRRKR